MDDECGIGDALNEILVDEGYDPHVARNGKDGVAQAKEFRPDLILLDFMMPIMDGRQMLERLQADATLAKIPVVMMSAVPEWNIRRTCCFETFLQKPFDLTAMLSAVEKTIGKGDPATRTFL